MIPGREPARPARGRAPGREAADGRRRGLPGRRGVRGGRPFVRRRAPSSCRWRRCSRATPRTSSRSRPIPKSAARRPRRRSRPTTSARGRSACCSASSTGSSSTPVGRRRKLEKLTAAPTIDGRVSGTGPRFVFDYRGPDARQGAERAAQAGRQGDARDRRGPRRRVGGHQRHARADRSRPRRRIRARR